jgi:hypothetical protein
MSGIRLARKAPATVSTPLPEVAPPARLLRAPSYERTSTSPPSCSRVWVATDASRTSASTTSAHRSPGEGTAYADHRGCGQPHERVPRASVARLTSIPRGCIAERGVSDRFRAAACQCRPANSARVRGDSRSTRRGAVPLSRTLTEVRPLRIGRSIQRNIL